MTNEDIIIHLQNTREIYVKIQILNQFNKIIDSLEGLAIDGSINIDSQSAIRRTCQVTFVLTSKLLPTPTSPIWLNKKFKLLIGIKNIITNEIKWYNQGIFLVNNPDVDISISDKTISISGLDSMCFYNGDISGQSSTRIIIDADIPIHEAIKSTMKNIGGELESNMIIETSPYTTPYKIEKDIGNHVYDVVKELVDLYKNYECFYDINGKFIFRKRKDLVNDPIIFDFRLYELQTQIRNNFIFSNVKNYIKVYGRLKDDGSQSSYEVEIRDGNYPNSPFTIEKLNEGKTRNLIITEDSYFTDEQCQSRVEYEQYLHNDLASSISINCLPLYFLDVNQKVYVKNIEAGIDGEYGINKISFPLNYDGLMSIEAHLIINIK